MEIGANKNLLYLVVLIIIAYLIIFRKPKTQSERKADKELINPNSPLSGQSYITSESNIRKVSGKKFLYIKQAEADRRAKLVYGAKGFLKDKDSQAMEALKVKNKEQIAQIAIAFAKLYNDSMIDYLKDFMDSKNFETLVERVNALK